MTHRPRWQKWLFAAIKLLVLGLMIWFLRATLRSAIDQLRDQTWHVQPAWLVLAGLCYVAGLMTVAFFWLTVLRSTGQDVAAFDTVRAYWVAQVGKYVPGKALVLVLRTGLLRNPKLETTVVAATVFTETLTQMAVGSLISFVVLLIAKWSELATAFGNVHSFGQIVGLIENDAVIMVGAALVMFVGTGLPTYPRMMKLLMKLLGVGKLNPTAGEKLGSVSYRVILFGWLIVACGWFFQGLGLWAVLRSIDATSGPPRSLPMNTATVAMSTIAGFLSFIPGGAGVREVVQTELMVGDYGQGPALVATLIWRLVMLVSEAILSSILYLAGPRGLRHKLGGPAKPTPP